MYIINLCFLAKNCQEFGGKDHTTVLHAYDKIKKDIDEKSELERDVDSIRRLLEK